MKKKINATTTSRIIELTGFPFKENPTYINAMATRLVAANNLIVKILETACAIIIITTAAIMPDINSVIFKRFVLQRCDYIKLHDGQEHVKNRHCERKNCFMIFLCTHTR